MLFEHTHIWCLHRHTQPTRLISLLRHIWLISVSAEKGKKRSFVLPTCRRKALIRVEGSSETTADWIWTMSIRGESALCVCVCVACSCTYQGEQIFVPNQMNVSMPAGSLQLSYVQMISETTLWLLRAERRWPPLRSLSFSFFSLFLFVCSLLRKRNLQNFHCKKEPKERLDSLLLLIVKDPTQLRLVWQMISGVLTMELISIIHYLYLQDGL